MRAGAFAAGLAVNGGCIRAPDSTKAKVLKGAVVTASKRVVKQEIDRISSFASNPIEKVTELLSDTGVNIIKEFWQRRGTLSVTAFSPWREYDRNFRFAFNYKFGRLRPGGARPKGEEE